MTLVLCWDIDGTLLTTGRAGIFAWEDAITEVLGEEVSLREYRTAGLTDVQIGRLLVQEIRGHADPDLADSVTRRYGELLASRLHRKQGRVLDNVVEILDEVRQQPDVLSLLLTGNTAVGAQAKLSHYGLSGYFDEGAFSDGTSERSEIAHRAVEMARARLTTVPSESVFVIGDTPHDIDCANAISARTVAVATGGYSIDELAEHDPWWLVPALPAPDEFLGRLRAAAGC